MKQLTFNFLEENPLIFIILFGYVFLLLTSKPIVIFVLKMISIPKSNNEQNNDSLNEVVSGNAKYLDTGFVIGICENFLILTFMVLHEFTGLALIFAAKGLIRKGEGDEKKANYYLVGTLVNFTYSVFVGGVMLILIDYFG